MWLPFLFGVIPTYGVLPYAMIPKDVHSCNYYPGPRKLWTSNPSVYLLIPKEQNFLFINKPPFTSYTTCPFTVTPETHLNDLMHSICQSLLWILNALHCSEQILSLKLVKLVCKACYHDKIWIQVQPLVCPSSTASKLTILRVLKVSVSIKLEILLASCQHRYLILCSWKLCQDLAGHNFLCGGWNL